ncbi:MAG: HD domain-containing protein [Dehalococcoidia bacterium]
MIADRIRQFRHAGGHPVAADFDLARQWLAAPLMALFEAQHPRDVVHSAETARWLLERGHEDPDLIAAGLLHDIGKGEQRRLDRTVYVLASHARLAPRLAASASKFELRRAVARTLTHSETGAFALEMAGASGRVVELTLRHHQAAGDDRVLALLQQADAAS